MNFQLGDFMKFFYVSRVTKDGYTLTTSYTSSVQAKKYGGDNPVIWEGVKFFDLQTVDFVSEPTDYAVRSRMKGSSSNASSSGKFHLYIIQDHKLVDTGLRFDSYGAANTTMKALINVYSDLVVLENISNNTQINGESLFKENLWKTN